VHRTAKVRHRALPLRGLDNSAAPRDWPRRLCPNFCATPVGLGFNGFGWCYWGAIRFV